MDHLPQLNEVHIQVPFVAENRIYTSGDFFKLPARTRCTLAELKQKGPQILPQDEAAAFLQGWLFFSLLAQVLNQDIDANDFLRQRHGERQVDSEDLIGLINDW